MQQLVLVRDDHIVAAGSRTTIRLVRTDDRGAPSKALRDDALRRQGAEARESRRPLPGHRRDLIVDATCQPLQFAARVLVPPPALVTTADPVGIGPRFLTIWFDSDCSAGPAAREMMRRDRVHNGIIVNEAKLYAAHPELRRTGEVVARTAEVAVPTDLVDTATGGLNVPGYGHIPPYMQRRTDTGFFADEVRAATGGRGGDR